MSDYSRLYQTAKWDQLRRYVYKRDGYQCQWQSCGRLLIGKAPADNSPIAHHRTPHRGDLSLFWDSKNIITVCKKCHDGPIKQFESRGYIGGYDEAGKPVDPSHPWNSGGTG